MDAVVEVFVRSFILNNDAAKELVLFESRRTQNNNKRRRIVQNITNMQKKLYLLQAAYLQSQNPEKKLWQLVSFLILINSRVIYVCTYVFQLLPRIAQSPSGKSIARRTATSFLNKTSE